MKATPSKASTALQTAILGYAIEVVRMHITELGLHNKACRAYFMDRNGWALGVDNLMSPMSNNPVRMLCVNLFVHALRT